MEPSNYERLLWETARSAGSALTLFVAIFVLLTLRSFSRRLTPWQTYAPLAVAAFGIFWAVSALAGYLLLSYGYLPVGDALTGDALASRQHARGMSVMAAVHFAIGTLPTGVMWLLFLFGRAAVLAAANRRRASCPPRARQAA